MSVSFSALILVHKEAEMAKNRIIELKQQDLQKRREELLLQQAQEREEVENAHVEEYQQFNK